MQASCLVRKITAVKKLGYTFRQTGIGSLLPPLEKLKHLRKTRYKEEKKWMSSHKSMLDPPFNSMIPPAQLAGGTMLESGTQTQGESLEFV